MAIVTGDRYVEKLQKFLEDEAESLLEETMILKLNPAGLHYLHLRLDSLRELERMLSNAPVDYLRAYVSDLGDYRALEQLRRILRILTSLKVVSTLPSPARDPTPLSLFPFGSLKVLELRRCDLSTSPAKGLIELRHTLEKIICHNSTDALRHVFASRIAEITNSPEWNKLAVISCACNRLVLMDESLQLLPAAESLDLSRNKFVKVDNLRRCTKLKHLDLGFNHLRTVSYLSQVSCHLVKLVLRNNALTTLRGIENLKSLQGLDVSYNIISNFSELEFLWSLSQLKELWLEGNPVCCARWYRAHVFSYVALPDELKLDGKQIGTREFWKRQIIVAHRQSEPASYGFYSPAREEDNEEGSCNRKKKKICRLASIHSEAESTYVNSDHESATCDHENKENMKFNQEADIFGLISKVEHLKKERSVLWLREFKEWMDRSTEDFADVCKDSQGINLEKKYYTKIREISRHHGGGTPRYTSGSLRASRAKSYRKNLECNGSCVDHKAGMDYMKYVEGNETQKITDDISSISLQSTDRNQKHQECVHDEMESLSVEPNDLLPTTLAKEKLAENGNMSTLDITQHMTGSTYPGSPPHYQKDVLYRRHNLVEEILQLSADSYSVASSDSTSSCSEDDNYDSESEYSNHKEGRLTDLLNVNRLGKEILECTPKGTRFLGSQPENGSTIKTLRTDESMKETTTNFPSGLHNGKHGVNQTDRLVECKAPDGSDMWTFGLDTKWTILVALLLGATPLIVLLGGPKLVGYVGRTVGFYLRQKTAGRKAQVLERVEIDQKEYKENKEKSRDSDDWENIESSSGIRGKEDKEWNGIVGFFHPFCNAGGGGERVLWAAVLATQKRWPNAKCIVYTGDHDVDKSQIIARVKDRFNIQLHPPTITFLYLTTRHWVLASTWPHFTLLGQSIGSLILAWDAFSLVVPDIFVDTMGYAFALGFCKILFPEVPTGAYVHYPTISTDMLGSLDPTSATGKQGVNAGKGTGLRGEAKKLYWKIFAKFYTWVGASIDVVLTNSNWTLDHITSLWGEWRRELKKPIATAVFPPVAVEELEEKISVTPESEAIRQPALLYIAQFRPEKNHTLILTAFAAFKATKSPATKGAKLILIGSVRDDSDSKRVYQLRLLANELQVKDDVEFHLDAPWPDILKWLGKASVGVNGMWNEHFGIGVVEYQAAGLISVVHDSGGPKRDIVTKIDGLPTGFHASTAEQFAEGFESALALPREDKIAMRLRARKSAQRFTEAEFAKKWIVGMEELVTLRRKWEGIRRTQ